MATQTTLERLEQQIIRLSVRERLGLIAYISEHLSITLMETEKQHAGDADELLTLCDTAADMWEGKFDAIREIHYMRQERDEQIWPSK